MYVYVCMYLLFVCLLFINIICEHVYLIFVNIKQINMNTHIFK